MSHPQDKKCCKEAIADLVSGLLDGESASKLHQHMQNCSDCRSYYEQMLHEEDLIKSAFESIRSDADVAIATVARNSAKATSHQKKPGNVLARAYGRYETMKFTHKAFSTSTVLAAVILVVLGVQSLFTTEAAFALSQTGQAMQDVRFMHMVARDEQGITWDERWIEILPKGIQGRYYQKSLVPAGMEVPDYLAWGIEIRDDQHTTGVYYPAKETLVLYKSISGGRYQWIGKIKAFLDDLAGRGDPNKVQVEPDVIHKGRPAHRVRLLDLNMVCYIDPETKLPFAVQDHDVHFGDPPAGIFTTAVPEGVKVVDVRDGEDPEKMPAWLGLGKGTEKTFAAARIALASGNVKEAAQHFRKFLKVEPLRNWAWFWLGKSHHELGNYELAIEAYSRVIVMYSAIGKSEQAPYAYYARGLAYQQAGKPEQAQADFDLVLPMMIDALTKPRAAYMFEFADDPLFRNLSRDQRDAKVDLIGTSNMIQRLRKITGQDFGYDSPGNPEENAKAIRAWKNWFKGQTATPRIRHTQVQSSR